MKASFAILPLILTACAPSVPVQAPAPFVVPTPVEREAAVVVKPKVAEVAKVPVQVVPSVEIPEKVVPRHSLRMETKRVNGIALTIVSYDRRDYGLKVADQASPGARWDTAREAAGNGIAAINGGFFTPEGKPLGVLITGGEKKGAVNRASFLGSGFFVGGMDRLMNQEDYLVARPKAQELLQSGPRLLWEGSIPKGLADGEKRPRSFLLWDENHHFAIAYADSASLSGLARILKSQPFSHFRIQSALNLDGGRSSDLWVSGSVKGGPVTRRSWINKSVRNYLVLHRK